MTRDRKVPLERLAAVFEVHRGGKGGLPALGDLVFTLLLSFSNPRAAE